MPAEPARAMDVLVTGGSGFIGSHVVDQLLAAGHRPRIFDARPSPHHTPDRVPIVVGDLADLDALDAAMDGCDAVIHLAASADVNEVEQDPVEAEQRNARGTLHVLEAARRAGVEAELLDAAPIDGARWGPCVRYPGQAHFHPTRFLAGLARAIARDGGRIHCGVRCKAIESGRPLTVVTSAGHRIEASTLVTTQPVANGGTVAGRPAPRMAHVVGLRVPRGSVPRALYWEAADPARWVRLRSQGTGAGEVLLVGGEDPVGDDDHTAYRYLGLEEWARSRFPFAGEVVQRFTGQLIQTPDVFALSTRGECDSESVYVPTGDWGTAMTRGTIAGMVIRDFADGADMPWADLYMPQACEAPRAPAAGTMERLG